VSLAAVARLSYASFGRAITSFRATPGLIVGGQAFSRMAVTILVRAVAILSLMHGERQYSYGATWMIFASMTPPFV
jgi:hypothetical protein